MAKKDVEDEEDFEEETPAKNKGQKKLSTGRYWKVSIVRH